MKENIKNYETGDSFYIPEATAKKWNKGFMNPAIPALEQAGAVLTPGEILVVLESPKEIMPIVKVRSVLPDGTKRKGEILRAILNSLPPDRRYGRELNALSKDRPKEIIGMVKKGLENEETRYRNTDTETILRELRTEALKIVYEINI